MHGAKLSQAVNSSAAAESHFHPNAAAFQEAAAFYFSPAQKQGVRVRGMRLHKGGAKSLDNNESKDHNENSIQLTAKEKKLLELIHNTRFGEIRVAVKDGQPVLVEEVKKSIKL